MADRPHDVSALTGPELERARRELTASLALSRPGSPALVPITAQLSAIDAELAARSGWREPRPVPGAPGVLLCSCGFSTDDPGWLDGHLSQHPGHHQRSGAPLP